MVLHSGSNVRRSGRDGKQCRYKTIKLPPPQRLRYQTLKYCKPHTTQSCASSKQVHITMSAFFSQTGVDTFTLDLLTAEYYPSFFPSNGEGIRTLGVSFTRAIWASCLLTYASIFRESSVKGVLKRGRMSGSLKAPTAQSAAPQPRAMTTTTTTLRDSDMRPNTVQILFWWLLGSGSLILTSYNCYRLS